MPAILHWSNKNLVVLYKIDKVKYFVLIQKKQKLIYSES